MTSLMAVRPPPPTPWMHLPTKSFVISVATPAITAPMKKNRMESIQSARRPNTSESAPVEESC